MPPALSSERIALTACPVCGSRDFRAVMQVGPHPVVACKGCGLQVTNPQPSDAELAAIYGPNYILVEGDAAAEAMVVRSKRATADHCLDLLAASGVPATGGKLLEIGCGQGNFLVQASRRGFDVTGVEYSAFACERARANLEGRGRVLHGEIGVLAHESAAYDVCVLCDVIEHVRDPAAFLREIKRLLRPGGAILVVTPSLDSWSARALRSRWMEYKAEHLFYYARETIRQQLAGAGFGDISLHRGVKKLSLEYIAAHFDKYPIAGITHVLRLLRAITPRRWGHHLFPVVASGLIAFARRPASSR
ncbi:MAG TPA: class I SAM-dependent methyltransferase [Opitutaceae bacterium]|nr:class I SAM-dependent methyltransferase [Opitutaceae bacterium]